ncbi:MAG: ABC transporter substrate-binding protein [Cyclobacteriaceae bacterium]|nr:ABC transporter substrate-binding protein [Cyclobacteriaceae bacterium]
MNLQYLLHGVTFECPQVALAEKQKVVRYVLEGNTYSSEEIDKIFSASKAQGKSLYFVDDDLLQAIQPDVIFTQDVCEVCQIDTECTSAAVAKLTKQPALVPLTPSGLDDVFATAITIASALGQEEKAYVYLASLQKRIDFIIDELRKAKAKPKRVMLMEWMEPIYNCGHWIPDQIAMAGGIDMLANPKGDSIVTQWNKIVRYDPEVLVVAPCGFHVDRSLQEIHLLSAQPEWKNLQAVRNGKVFIVDFDLFTQPSASTLVDGIEVLAALFNPNLFSVPLLLKNKVVQLEIEVHWVVKK